MATQFAEEQQRGTGVLYRPDETNRCPGCGQRQWIVGRASAECAFCSTAIPIIEGARGGSPVFRSRGRCDAFAPNASLGRIVPVGEG